MDLNTSLPTTPPENSAPEIPPSQPVNNLRRKFPLVIGVLILLLLVSGGMYYLGTQNPASQSTKATSENTKQSNNEVSPTVSIINGWKVYSSPYGYSFDYPPSWGVEESFGDNGAQVWSDPEYIVLSKQEQQGFDKEDYAKIEVSSYLSGSDTAFGKVDSNTDLQTFVQNHHGDALVSLTETSLDGKPALLAVVKREVLKDGYPIGTQNCPTSESCMTESGQVKYVWTKIDGDIMGINYWYGRTYEGVSDLNTIFDNLISSFKFTN